MDYSVAVRNAQLDTMENTIGASPTMHIMTSAVGTILASPVMPANWLDAASGGVKSGAALPWVAVAIATGVATYFEIRDSGGTPHISGTVGLVGSGADLEISSVNISSGGTVSVTTFAITGGNI